MVRFLSPQWVDAMNAAAADATVDPDVRVSVGQAVDDVSYRVDVADGKVAFVHGTTDGADLTLVQDRATAVAIARGELPAQQAVADGRLCLRGDVRALVANAPALAAVADAFARVRDDTEF